MYNGYRWHFGRWIALGFLALFGVMVAAMVYFLLFTPPAVAPMPYYGWFPFGFFGFFFLVFIFFGVLRWAFFPWRWGYRGYGYGYYGHRDGAYHVLRERYARGEITKDQYDRMMADLYPQPRQGP